jgi:hypothetical protein
MIGSPPACRSRCGQRPSDEASQSEITVIDRRDPLTDINVAAGDAIRGGHSHPTGRRSRDLTGRDLALIIVFIENTRLCQIGQRPFQAAGWVRTAALGISLGIFDGGLDLLLV